MVTLIGRVRGLRHGTRRAQNSRERARLQNGQPRFQVEHLEARMLLASGQIQAALQLQPLGVLSPIAAISYTHSVTPSYGREAVGFTSLRQAGRSYFDPVQLTISTEDGSLTWFLVGMNVAFPGTFGGGFVRLAPRSGNRELFENTLVPAKPMIAMHSHFEWVSESYGLTLHVIAESGPALVTGGSIDSHGAPPGQVGSLVGTGGAPAPAFSGAARGSPNGGPLVVPILTSGSPTATEEGTIAGSAAALIWSAPFVVSVMRHEVQDPTIPISEPAQGSLAAGTLAFLSSALSGVPSSFDTPVLVTTAVTIDNALRAPDESSPVIAVADETPSDSWDGFTLRVPTGPFVSRNAGPLGPILASVGGDPTPEVERNERALYQEIERRDPDAGNDQGDQGYELTRNEAGEDEPGEGGGSVLAVSGAGGFPLKVAALPKYRRTDLSALVSAIPTAAGLEAASEEPAERAHWIDPGQVAAIAEASMPADATAYSSLIKAACVLALGLGMSYRALLFPDLLASVQRRVRGFRSRARHRRKPTA